MSQSIIHSSTHADALENPSTAALDDLLDNDKDLPLLADTHLLSRVLLTVIAQQTSTPVKQTIDKLLNGEDPHQKDDDDHEHLDQCRTGSTVCSHDKFLLPDAVSQAKEPPASCGR